MKLSPLLCAAGLAFAALSPAAFAISEQGYEETFARDVAPFFEAGERGEFPGVAGVPIRHISFVNPHARGAIVVSNGYTENFFKYAELTYDLYQAGYSVFLLDHRGQGSSGRLIADATLGYIDRFDNFAIDLRTFVNQVAKPKARAGQPFLLLAHSMGGAIGARYLELFPEDFTAAVLSAPMFGVQLGPWDPSVAKAILRSLEFIGQGPAIALGKSRQNPSNEPFEKNELTHSPARYRMGRETLKRFPGAVLEAPTNSWVLRAMLGGEKAERRGKAIRVPVLVFQAGQDSYVTLPPQESFCRITPSCRLEKVPGSRHEVLMESDSMRAPALQKILDFFAVPRGPAPASLSPRARAAR